MVRVQTIGLFFVKMALKLCHGPRQLFLYSLGRYSQLVSHLFICMVVVVTFFQDILRALRHLPYLAFYCLNAALPQSPRLTVVVGYVLQPHAVNVRIVFLPVDFVQASVPYASVEIATEFRLVDVLAVVPRRRKHFAYNVFCRLLVACDV